MPVDRREHPLRVPVVPVAPHAERPARFLRLERSPERGGTVAVAPLGRHPGELGQGCEDRLAVAEGANPDSESWAYAAAVLAEVAHLEIDEVTRRPRQEHLP